jgi:hypothetical protein
MKLLLTANGGRFSMQPFRGQGKGVVELGRGGMGECDDVDKRRAAQMPFEVDENMSKCERAIGM